MQVLPVDCRQLFSAATTTGMVLVRHDTVAVLKEQFSIFSNCSRTKSKIHQQQFTLKQVHVDASCRISLTFFVIGVMR